MHQLHPYIRRKDTNYRQAVDTPRRLAIFLEYAASAVSMEFLGQKYGYGKSSAQYICKEVPKAIYHVFHELGGFLGSFNVLHTLFKAIALRDCRISHSGRNKNKESMSKS